jgi:hypothetical protein
VSSVGERVSRSRTSGFSQPARDSGLSGEEADETQNERSDRTGFVFHRIAFLPRIHAKAEIGTQPVFRLRRPSARLCCPVAEIAGLCPSTSIQNLLLFRIIVEIRNESARPQMTEMNRVLPHERPLKISRITIRRCFCLSPWERTEVRESTIQNPESRGRQSRSRTNQPPTNLSRRVVSP